MSEFWSSRTVLLTGGHGFLGSCVRRKLESKKPATLLAPSRDELDLRDGNAVRDYIAAHKPNVVIHCAAIVGGIGANRMYPGRFFYENAIMGIQLIENARLANVEKFVCLGTICAYPKFTPVPFHEEELWNGYPEETNAPYGLAKKMLLVQLQAYRQEYGFRGVYLLPVNLYGPGDDFDVEMGHVIPVMIRKFSDAAASNAPHVTLWGDGSPTREFLFVEDAAEAIVLAAEKYDSPEPINIGRGAEISIRDLAALVKSITGFNGEIVWDATKPNGQPRRMLDTARAAQALGWRAQTEFEDGLRRTVEWYRKKVMSDDR